MSNYEFLKIAIAEPSVIIRSGIIAALKRMPKFKIQIVEITSFDVLTQQLMLQKPDILIVNPTFWGAINLAKLKDESALLKLKSLAIVYSFVDDSLLKQFDDTINIFDNIEQLNVKIEQLAIKEQPVEADLLSVREKEIVRRVVKGLTNKEIANSLFLSTHTVITHRRNIARKLEIHSTAGLTVYAIVNNLVELEDVKKSR